MAAAASLDVPSTQIFYRIQTGWQTCTQNDDGRVSAPSELTPCGDHNLIFSPDGSHIASIIENAVQIFDTSSGELLFTIHHERVRNVYFSPLNTYLFTYHRRLSADGNSGNFVGFQLYEPCDTQGVRSGILPERNAINPEHEPVEIMRLFVKDFDAKNPVISFSADERIACRAVKDGVIILHGRNLNGRPIIKESIEGARTVSCAPTFNKTPLSICVFTPIRKGRPANVSIYTLNKNRLFRGATRSFYDVDTIQFLWNNRGDCVLVFASSEVDTSGQSYYGHNSLFLFHTDDNLTAQIPISRSGKLQDVAWHPDSREFVMVDDHPMKLSAFDWKGGLKHSFGTCARNTLRFSPRGRFLWAGGFGNLNGEMDFWEYASRTHLGYAEDESCRYYSWSPDGRTFITARTFPLRTVDNGYRVYKYNGDKLLDVPFERLYQIAYRPHITHRPTWEDRRVFGHKEKSPSPGAVRAATRNAAKPKMKKAYVPPHMRNRGGGGGRGRGRGGRGGSQARRQKHVVGLGFVDVPDSADSTMSLSERLSDRVDSQNHQPGSGKSRRRNRRKGKQQQQQGGGESKEAENGEGRRSSYSQQRQQQQQQQQQNDDDDGAFWPRGQKFGVVAPEKNGNNEGSSGKKRKRKRRKKNTGGNAPPAGDGEAAPPAESTGAPSREDVASAAPAE